jgi:hypothetical protein
VERGRASSSPNRALQQAEPDVHRMGNPHVGEPAHGAGSAAQHDAFRQWRARHRPRRSEGHSPGGGSCRLCWPDVEGGCNGENDAVAALRVLVDEFRLSLFATGSRTVADLRENATLVPMY